MTEHQPELIPQTNATTTPEEQAKRNEYRRRLAEYLKDPEFRAIEGFPIGTDEDILALSDPPYYTACPNPFLPEIIEQWQQEREEIRQKLGLKEEKYQREPFAADVSEGKNDPIYNAHSYHTKVPHKAIMRYILHYTDPGDIVFDGFCGTGMTGVAGGDLVEITLALDTEPRTVTVPEDLAEALQTAGLRAEFDAASYSVRKEYVRQVESAKAAETRVRRIGVIVDRLRG